MTSDTNKPSEQQGPPRCESSGCDSEAAARVFWPGSKPLNMCALCVIGAQRVGQAMGHYIHAEALHA